MARDKSIADWIRSKRQESGLSQDALAKHVGCSGMTIGNWENGKTTPNEASVKELEQVLGPHTSAEGGAEGQDFGNWLRTERTALGVTQQQLADAAVVNAVTISIIELGKIRRPQRDTVRRLEVALGKQYPGRLPSKKPDQTQATSEPKGSPVQLEEEWSDEVEVGIGPFIEFNPYAEEELPDEPGIYVLYDISERPIYVGKAQNIRSRIKDHDRGFYFKKPIVETAAYIRVDNGQLRNRLEQVLIKFMKSNAVLNKQHVER